MTIGCYIKILQIKDELNNKLTYQCPMRYHHDFSRLIQNSKLGFTFNMKWKLTEKERRLKMRFARPGQRFESKIISERFCFSVYPNGINPESKGQVILCLHLCLLPPGISKLTMRYVVNKIIIYVSPSHLLLHHVLSNI